MTIEINEVHSNLVHIAGDNGQVSTHNGGTAPSGSSAPGPGSDQISLTESAIRLQKLERDVSNQPVVDSQKVADMQHAVANGSIQIDPARIAEQMLKMEHGLP